MSELMPEGNPAGEPLEDQWLYAQDETDQGAENWGNMHPIPVKVHHDVSEQAAPGATSWMSYPIALAPALAGTGTSTGPTMVCPHRYHRHKAKFLFTATGACTIFVDKVPDRLMSSIGGAGSLPSTFQIVIGGAITQSAQLLPDYDGMQPLYMVATAAGVVVSVMDEGHKVVQ